MEIHEYQHVIIKTLVLLCCCFLMACGVRGRPQPPEEPVAIGDGQPSYIQNQTDLENIVDDKKKKPKKDKK